MEEKEDMPPTQELRPELFRNEPKIHPPTVRIKRSRESWAFHYAFLGVALTIEIGLIALISPPYWGFWLLLVIGITLYLILDNRWFQERLARLQNRLENKFR